MKSSFLNGLVGIGMVFLAACAVEGQSLGGGRLAGTWDAAVRITNCETGDVDRTFASIASFNQGGTSIGSTSGLPQSGRTPEHGIWRHVSGNAYRFKFKSFNFNPAGQAVSYAIVEHDLYLNETADAYYSEGTARFFLLNGTQVGSGCSDAVGTKMTF